MRRIWLILLLASFTSTIVAQTLTIEDIIFVGNKKTKNSIITRELDISIGDTIDISLLQSTLDRNTKRLLSIGLFTAVNPNVIEWDTELHKIKLQFVFQENWYIYPAPILEFADRDFNVWWKEYRFDPTRTNFGVRLDHLNTSGHKDRLKVKFQRGYTYKYELIYEYPYIFGGWGLGCNFFLSQNREMPYATRANTLLFFKHADERVLLTRMRSGVQLTKRSDAYTFHNIKLEFHRNTIDDYVAQVLNPNYFLREDQSISFAYIEYDWVKDKRIFPTYPEGGTLWGVNLKAYGLGLSPDYNNVSLSITGEHYWNLRPNLVYGGRVKAKSNLIRNTLGYANNTSLGYDEKLRGYELYVVDGSDYGIIGTDLKWRLLDKTYDLGKRALLSQFKLCQIYVWLRLSMDAGYVNEPTYIPTNTFTNRMLYGGGPALDIFLYNTFRVSMEYNANHTRESQFYLKGGIYFR